MSTRELEGTGVEWELKREGGRGDQVGEEKEVGEEKKEGGEERGGGEEKDGEEMDNKSFSFFFKHL